MVTGAIGDDSPSASGFGPRAYAGSGRSHRIISQSYGRRPLLLLSDAEYAEFLRHNWRSNAVYIEAQKPCDIEMTQRIAIDLGIRHPWHKGGVSTLSTDLVVTLEDTGRYRTEAVSVKHYLSHISDRAHRHRQIEQRYHELRGATWVEVRSFGLNSDWARNLFWVFPFLEDAVKHGFDHRQREAHTRFLWGLNRFKAERSVTDLFARLSGHGVLKPAEAARSFRELLAVQHLETEMNVPMLNARPPTAFVVRNYDFLNRRRSRLGKAPVN